ncbi:adenylate/guanylate cyclase domain-containing protein [Denitratisoma oestradiolicum]|uniref:Guanylate cyclase domain-containing protein n=1 Tax=Denitratisoma oestradiolicum TaxID=311182 RepID=A0A6S6XRS8_9PROT|nr:adenylate/guanylate cyclase domain-containing protein [Denitratisoma oestradiolicum]CAB1367390.1 conserved membrane protein of unknown function [Denitratisoma oestradiolicum]
MTTMRRLTTKAWLLALCATFLSVGVAESLYRSGFADRAESLYSDLWHRLAGKHHEASHVALVMIDDPTLSSQPDEPLAFWTPHFARALGVLDAVGAKTVALDFLFSGSPERWLEKLKLAPEEATRSYDQPFRQQINRGNVLLAAFRIGDGDKEGDYILPSPDYLLALPDFALVPHVGLANLEADADGVVRRFAANGTRRTLEGMPHLTLGMLAAIRHTGQDPTAAHWRFGNRTVAAQDAWPIVFAGPPGSIAALSFQRLLAPNAERDPAVRALAGKAVVIGAGYAGMNDVHPTPYSTTLGRANALMSGPEIQASIIESLLSGSFVDPLSNWLRLATFAAAFGILAFLGMRLPMSWTLLLAMALALGFTFIAYLLHGRMVLFPLAHLHLGLGMVVGTLFLLRLTREERERSHLNALFGRYVSPQVMTALLASPELPELGGQAMRVTVLFSDIRNFTTLSEKLTPKEVVEMLNTYLEQACTVLLKEGATIDKFIGDAIMAEFGAPLRQDDHAARALRAAVALRKVAVEFRTWMEVRFAGRGLSQFDIGIGIHTGDAVVGNIGASSRMEYTAIGDTVNTASRLEGMTKEVGAPILASQATVDAAGPVVVTGAHHALKVKGRAQLVAACEILGIS